jgi:hypothetical protein
MDTIVALAPPAYLAKTPENAKIHASWRVIRGIPVAFVLTPVEQVSRLRSSAAGRGSGPLR